MTGGNLTGKSLHIAVLALFHSHLSGNAGSTSGFGRRLVGLALARGDRVIATARNSEKLEKLVHTCDKDVRNNLQTVQLDVLEGVASIKSKADIAFAIWGQIDVVVNNAGKALTKKPAFFINTSS